MITKNKLNDIANNSLYCAGASGMTIKYSFEIFKRYIKGKNILELGSAEGVMTEFFYKMPLDLTIVEGAEVFCKRLKERFPKAKVINSLFEDFHSEEKFDNIILGHVLEHVDNPVEILKKLKPILSPNGTILAAVPNSNSIHRQAAVKMGILEKTNSMSELDYHHGHKRVYSINEFKNDFIQAGFNIKKIGGYWLKPVSNKQIEESWTEEMLIAFMALGELYPEIAAEIYVVAKL